MKRRNKVNHLKGKIICFDDAMGYITIIDGNTVTKVESQTAEENDFGLPDVSVNSCDQDSFTPTSDEDAKWIESYLTSFDWPGDAKIAIISSRNDSTDIYFVNEISEIDDYFHSISDIPEKVKVIISAGARKVLNGDMPNFYYELEPNPMEEKDVEVAVLRYKAKTIKDYENGDDYNKDSEAVDRLAEYFKIPTSCKSTDLCKIVFFPDEEYSSINFNTLILDGFNVDDLPKIPYVQIPKINEFDNILFICHTEGNKYLPLAIGNFKLKDVKHIKHMTGALYEKRFDWLVDKEEG